MQRRTYLLTSLLPWMMGAATAQDAGQIDGVKIFTIRQITPNTSMLDKTDAAVALRGRLEGRITRDTYWFRDSTGKIVAEIDEAAVKSLSPDTATELLIIGEVDDDLLEGVEIKVEKLMVTKTLNGAPLPERKSDDESKRSR